MATEVLNTLPGGGDASHKSSRPTDQHRFAGAQHNHYQQQQQNSRRGVKRRRAQPHTAAAPLSFSAVPAKQRRSNSFEDDEAKRRFTSGDITEDDNNQTTSPLKQRRASSGAAGNNTKKRRRRQKRRNKNIKGYYEMTDAERDRYEARTKAKLERIKARMLAKGHMLAPYNSTAFLINDANDDEVKRLDAALHDATSSAASPAHSSGDDSVTTSGGEPGKIRSRNSSFSVDSEADDYFYSSPDDEEEFLSKEFSKDYERGGFERLENMEKDQLIIEYLGMEKRVESLEKRLEEIQDREAIKQLTGESNPAEYSFSRSQSDNTAHKIKLFKAEICRLMKENQVLHMENSRLKRKYQQNPHQPYSNESHRGDDVESTTTDFSDDIADNNSNDDVLSSKIADFVAASSSAAKAVMLTNNTEDTGYESTQSKEQTPERDLNSGDKRRYPTDG
eukprot:TRINITY_DN23430_c0_g1_i3.p1 TRINITY_DN23430_c0_g1~~TRINITY_DN23430_c0_g1_i3.p1  ORF type:complete len:448 (+),score=171.40 TRINITY_DN23430_c0_g1_i3:179-1522(+)